MSLLADGAGSVMDFAQYGLAGLMFATIVIPLAIYILRDKDRQIQKAEAEIIRQRGELAELRKVLDPIAPALSEMGRTMSTAINILERTRQ